MLKTTLLYLTMLALLTGLTPRPLAAAEWPQWLGPQRNGISSETGLLKIWPEAGPTQVWRQNVDGGFSGISIKDGRAYTMILSDGGEYIVCLDAHSGQEIWRFKSGDHYKEDSGGHGPRATPTLDGGRLYSISAGGQVYALDAATGKKLWENNLIKDFGGELPGFGYSNSPLIEGDLLLLEGGGRDRGLIAINKKTGQVKWAAHSDKTGYSSPIVATIQGVHQAIFFTGKAAVGINPNNGELYWRFPWETSYDINAATPLFVPPDKIYISSGYDTGAGLLRIKKNGDALAAEEVWTNRSMKNHFATSVIVGDYLYGFDNSILKCLEVRTGEEQWKQRGYGKGTLIVADGHLIILGEKGNLALAKPSPQGFQEISSMAVLKGKCWTVPAVANGKLYVRDEKEIVCLDIKGT